MKQFITRLHIARNDKANMKKCITRLHTITMIKQI